MILKDINSVYFIGIGGIGMSALARYFVSEGIKVIGYDKTESSITRGLCEMGVDIAYDDKISHVPKDIGLIVYTPAIPDSLRIYKHVKEAGFLVKKRAEVLGLLANTYFNIAVAGTHGKTSISALTAHLFHSASKPCHAFIGGIAKNYMSNWLKGEQDVVVVEADEFDASFLHLRPNMAVVSAMDADHLDIYGNKKSIEKAFQDFADNVDRNGVLFYRDGLNLSGPNNCYSYGIEKGDFRAQNISFNINKNGEPQCSFDFNFQGEILSGMKLSIPGLHNIENAVAASAIAYKNGLSSEEIASGLSSYLGISRRFDYQSYSLPVFIDDYAHHPKEIKVMLDSIKVLYPKKKITGVFQPHLYTRTRDFADEFAESLSSLDSLILLEIYPAREEPIQGVSSDMLLEKIKIKDKILLSLDELVAHINLRKKEIEVLVTMGAGSIDKKILEIKNILSNEG